jgi:hypothetical protein
VVVLTPEKNSVAKLPQRLKIAENPTSTSKIDAARAMLYATSMGLGVFLSQYHLEPGSAILMPQVDQRL